MVTLDFSITNWITVVLMAALGFMVLSFGAQAWKKYGPSNG